MSTVRVLIVDDHPNVRASLQLILNISDELQVVGAASHGTQAIEMANEFLPDVILMDLNLPNMDGIAITKILRQQIPSSQILILTGSVDPQQIQAAIAAGAAGYIAKIGGTDEIIAAILNLANNKSP